MNPLSLICLSLLLINYLSFSQFLFLSLSFCLSLNLSIYLSLTLAFSHSLSPSASLSISLSIFLSLSLSLPLPLYLYLSPFPLFLFITLYFAAFLTLPLLFMKHILISTARSYFLHYHSSSFRLNLPPSMLLFLTLSFSSFFLFFP